MGDVWAFTFATGCGYPMFINDTWWMPTTLTFTHPEYPSDWVVAILDQGLVDGPTARIYNTTISLVEDDLVEIRTDDGELVAIYEPSDPPGLCG